MNAKKEASNYFIMVKNITFFGQVHLISIEHTRKCAIQADSGQNMKDKYGGYTKYMGERTFCSRTEHNFKYKIANL